MRARPWRRPSLHSHPSAFGGADGDYFAALLNLLFLLGAVAVILGLSLSSTRPFDSHPIVLACMLWFFVASLVCLIWSFSAMAGTLADDHDARVLGASPATRARMRRCPPASLAIAGLILGIFQTWGIAFVFAGFVSGISASTWEKETGREPAVKQGLLAVQPGQAPAV